MQRDCRLRAGSTEDEDQLLRKLLLKKFGYALPEIRASSEVHNLNLNLIDLTNDDDKEMEAVATAAPVLVPTPVIKTAPIEASEAAEDNPNPNAPTVAKVAAARKGRKEMARTCKVLCQVLAKNESGSG
jgi:hypothetical protein